MMSGGGMIKTGGGKQDSRVRLTDAAEQALSDLRSRQESTQLRGMMVLKERVETEAREVSREEFSAFVTELNKRIFDLVKSDAPHEKLGGILAMDGLIDVECEESSTFITRFANYLRLLLPCNDVPTMITASKVLGHLAQAGGTLTADFVEFEVKRALEGLNSEKRVEQQRLASVLVLKELATNAPTLFYMHVPAFLKTIWAGIGDIKQMIREAAIENLRACLFLISERDSSVRTKWYMEVFEEANRRLRSGQLEVLHGALLAAGELLRINVGILSEDKVADVYNLVMRQKDNKDSLIRRTVINLLPMLARFNPEQFCERYLTDSINHLIMILRKGSERSSPYLALGAIVSIAGQRARPWLDDIVELIDDGIVPKSRKPHCYEAVTCLASVAEALPDDPTLLVRAPMLLEQMFSGTGGRLDPRMVSAISDVARSMPSLLPDIQLRLLDAVSFILQMTPYQPSGTPKNRRIAPFRSQTIGPGDDTFERHQAVIQALQALCRFDFAGAHLLEFVRDCVSVYLDDPSPVVRMEAAQTCIKFLLPPGEPLPKRGAAAGLICQVIEKLLAVSVGDPDGQIRLGVLNLFDARFDYFLSQAETIALLFVALNDEIFVVREASIQIVARLTLRNPAHVMPTLRKMLVQLLTALEFGAEGSREQSARLFGHVILACHHLIKPYVAPVLQAILPKLCDCNPNVSANVLKTVGVLSRVGSQEVLKRRDEIFPIVIDALQDQSSSMKREVSLRTLGVLIQSTGYVIEPFERYPELLSVMSARIQAETSPSIRKEYIKVMGILGAVDPHRLKTVDMHKRLHGPMNQLGSGGHATGDGKGRRSEVEAYGPSSDEYYPSVAITQLMKILNDQSLSSHHMMVIQAVLFIFRTLGLKCVSLLPQIIPPMLDLVKSSQQGLREFLFQQLSILVAIVKQHIRPYLPQIFELVHEFWPQSALQPQILTFIEEITVALKDEFKVYIPNLVPKLLAILNLSFGRRSPVTCLKVLRVLELFDANLEQYLHITIPAVVRLAETPDANMDVRVGSINWISHMSRKLNFSEFASRLIQPLARILEGDSANTPELRRPVMDALCSLIFALERQFLIFVPVIEGVLSRKKIVDARYRTLVQKLQAGQPLPLDDGTWEDEGGNSILAPTEEQLPVDVGAVKKIAVNQQNLKRSWEASHRSTKEDWTDWMRRFAVELLRESPSPALRSCAALANVFHPLARELFNAAFVSCWGELYDQYRDSLMRALETALSEEKSPHIPAEVLQTLLTLAEFMEHDEKPLPIDIRKLGNVAEKCQAYAKSLHYKELEFLTSPSTCIQSLISINNSLGQPEAANGLLAYAQDNLKVELKESWYEKLRRWDEALEGYQRRLSEPVLEGGESARLEATEGCMRCLSHLGEWEQAAQLAEMEWAGADLPAKRRLAPMAANAWWRGGRLDAMRVFLPYMDEKTVDGAFCRGLLLVHDGKFDDALQVLDTARDLMYTEVSALVGESYERAYKSVVKAQQVAELEEVIMYRQSYERADGAEHREHLRQMWGERLKGIQGDVDVWRGILAVHSLVVPPHDNSQAWLKFAALCRNTKRFNLSEKALSTLLGGADKGSLHELATSVEPTVALAWFKHLWEVGEKDKALLGMQTFARVGKGNHSVMARCHLKLGEWVWSIGEDHVDDALIQRVLGSMRSATQHDNSWAKAWHKWALFNFEAITHYESHGTSRGHHTVNPYIQPAVSGFFRSISLRRAHVQQDILRLLTLWFKYGGQHDVDLALSDGFLTLSIDTWLDVIPQIIARINTPEPRVKASIHDLLLRIGKEHPQALIYSLTVASKSASHARRGAAEQILEQMEAFAPLLVKQAKLVSEELIRVAILWHEQWHEALEEASRLYFAERNVEGMLEALRPMHEKMQQGPETMREMNFMQQLGRDLQEAQDCCDRYRTSKNEKDLQTAWDLYYHVFRKINKQLPQMTSLDLAYVSPKLLNARDLVLAIPGQYRPGAPVVSIKSVHSTLTVITSKQRPRKCTMVGSDGKDYSYLLKGHEDLRQDERVMQLFGLVNTLLANDAENSRRDIQIVRYAVIPLSHQSGLIEWVPDCDTLHALIRDYRDSRKILLNIEHRLMLAMAPDYDNLQVMGKVEVFKHALDNTTGQDLSKVLWLKSTHSEDWLDRRTNYTRSLALMSMVGYVLGLGDRHPSNLMMHKYSGEVVHIDFGDCFEVAMHRDKFPEKIPFRLTRMLTSAMEVCGIEGTFRFTCESVMRVMRHDKGSVMAMLEAFVHDPLINWRLLGNDLTVKPSDAARADAPSSHAVGLSSGAAAAPGGVGVGAGGGDAGGGAQEVASRSRGHSHSHAGQAPQLNIGALGNEAYAGGEHNLSESATHTEDDSSDADSDDIHSDVPSIPASLHPRYGSVQFAAAAMQGEEPERHGTQGEAINQKAVKVITRVQHKLTGRDFDVEQVLTVGDQVDKLIKQATSRENLCQCYIGWCPFW